MILQALNDYYERKSREPSSQIPPYGFSEQRISFCFVLSKDGELLQAIDLRDGQGKKAKPKLLVVPLLPSKRANKVVSNFLWDKTGYVLGSGHPKSLAKDPERFHKTFAEFCTLHREVGVAVRDEGLMSLLAFLEKWSPTRCAELDNWEEIQDENLVFRLEGDSGYLHERAALRKVWASLYGKMAEGPEGTCLVTGKRQPITGLHPPIKGVGSQTSGASLVSFNLAAFTSYRKEKSFNAPVSDSAAFAYTAGLNFLLRKGSRQRIQLGDSATVFWADRSTPAENLLAALFNPPGSDKASNSNDSAVKEDPTTTALVREILQAAKSGKPLGTIDPSLDPEVRFYVLGLSPNNARLAVRFWSVSTFGQLLERVGQYFRDLEIERQYPDDPESPPLWKVLLETASLRKSENVPPLIAGAVTRAILEGSRYPRSLLTGILGRIRADHSMNYLRAAIIKACLVRNHEKEVPMSLDPERKDPGYCLGRLFALLEKAQKDATNPSATIRDRYFGAASATPATVFPQLLRLGQHHISKAEYGGYTDKLIAEVMERIDVLPKHLSLEDQGVFTLGYYHQRNALFRKSEKE